MFGFGGQSVGNLYMDLELRTKKLFDGQKKSSEILNKLNKEISDIQGQINSKLATIGGALSIGITAPLTMMGKQAISTFANFEQAMQNTYSVMSASGAEMEALKNKAEQMGATTRFSASQAAQALYSLGSAGQNAGQAINSLDGVLELAGATGSDLAYTSSTIASTLSQFNLEADKAGHIADVFSMAISKSQANMGKLSYSMKYVGPVASGLNISLEKATATLMQLYNTGFGGEQAGTILRAGLQKLASGSGDLVSKLEKVGLTFDDVNPKTNDLADILDRLKEAQVGVTEANEIFGEASSAGMAKLIEKGGDAIRTMDGLLTASDGAAKEMQKIQNASFANTQAELRSAFEAVQITLVSNVIPVVDKIVKMFTGVLKTVNDLPVGIQTAGTALLTFASLVGPLLLITVGIRKIKDEMEMLNVAMLKNPIFLAGAVIAGVGAIAMGVIAQVRKAHEDWVHGAKKSVEEIKKIQEEALKDGNKGRKINSLVDEYELLKSKTARSADEQKRYNEILKELNTLLPKSVVELNKQGKAISLNSEKARAAAIKNLETEKQKLEYAKTLARIKAPQADDVIKEYESKQKEYAQRAEKLLDSLSKTGSDVFKLKNLTEKRKEAKAKGYSHYVKNIDKQIKEIGAKYNLLKKVSSSGNGEYERPVTEISGALEELQKELLNKSKYTAEQLQKTTDIILENQKSKTELEALAKKETTLNASLSGLQNSKESIKITKKDAISSAWKEWIKFQKEDIKDIQEAKKISGEKFNANEEFAKFLQNKITELSKRTDLVNEKGEKVKLNSVDLKKFIDPRDFYESFKNSSGVKIKSNKSLADKLKEEIDLVDTIYKERIQKAKEFGKDENKIQEEYLKKRKAIIDKLIKTHGAETKIDIKADITLEDEKFKTELMGRETNAFSEFKKQVDGWKKGLEIVNSEIINTQEEIKRLNEEGADPTVANMFLEGQKEQANELRRKLGENIFTLNELEQGMNEISNLGKSKYKLKLIDINKEKEKLTAIAKQANTENGKLNEEKFNEAKDAIEKSANIAKATMGLEILNGVIGVADTIADVIMGAISKGGIDGLGAMQALGQLTSQIGSMFGDPISKAIGGAITGIVGIVSKIRGAIDQSAKAEAEKMVEEINAKYDETKVYISSDLRMETFDNAYQKAIDEGKDHFIAIEEAMEAHQNYIENQYKEFADKATTKLLTEIEEGIKDKSNSPMLNAVQSIMGSLTNAFETGDYSSLKESLNTALRKAIVGKVLVFSGLDKKIQDIMDKSFEGVKKSGMQKYNEKQEEVKQTEEALKKLEISYEKYLDYEDKIKDAKSKDYFGSLINTGHTARYWRKQAEELEKAQIEYKAEYEKYLSLKSKLLQKEEELKELEKHKDDKADFSKTQKFNKEKLENEIDDYKKQIKELMTAFGVDNENEVEKMLNELSTSLSEGLSSSLADSAYNADWDSFKKAFAGEMKKAIIQTAMQSAGLKAKVDDIVKNIMADGKITGSEMNLAMNDLKDLYDNMEENMAELSKIAKSFEGGVELQSKNSGTIIQQLSGSDRDWFLEVFKDGFSKINQAIELNELTVQQLKATQVIINSMTFNSYNGSVYIQAKEDTNLKELLTEIVQEAMAG